MRLTVRAKVLMGFSNWADVEGYFDEDFHGGHHHEYTIDEFRMVFDRSGFSIKRFMLYESNLREVDIESLGDLKSQTRLYHGTKRRERLPVTIAKKILLLTTELFPRLRSNMMLVARKPA
jgi:hypothetical protein